MKTIAAPRHPAPAAESAKLAPLPEAEPEPEQQAGLLVVHADVVKKCQIHEALPQPSSGWKSVLQSIAACMKNGRLKSRHVFVQGDERARDTVRYVLAKMGIDEKRVEMKPATQTNGRDESTIDIALTRVEVGHDGAKGISVRVNRHEMVAFLAEDIVE